MADLTKSIDPPPSIVVRLRFCRRAFSLSQKTLAGRVGLTRDQLAAIEQGRTPLRFWPGWKICRELNINQVWVLTGQGREAPFIDLDLSFIETALSERSTFIEICSTLLQSRLNTFSRMETTVPPPPHRGGAQSALIFLSPEWAKQRVIRLRDQAQEFLKEAAAIEMQLGVESQNKDLTQVTASGNIRSMKSPLANLLERLKKATAERGMKSKLAEAFDVPLSNVSQWLSGEREPGGETTLRLLAWVEQQERQSTPQPSPKHK